MHCSTHLRHDAMLKLSDDATNDEFNEQQILQELQLN